MCFSYQLPPNVTGHRCKGHIIIASCFRACNSDWSDAHQSELVRQSERLTNHTIPIHYERGVTMYLGWIIVWVYLSCHDPTQKTGWGRATFRAAWWNIIPHYSIVVLSSVFRCWSCAARYVFHISFFHFVLSLIIVIHGLKSGSITSR